MAETPAVVMIVEDNAALRQALAKLLRQKGYETMYAANGVEALERARTTRPDLIVLDIYMPEMDGITFLKHLRVDWQLADIPVVVNTAVADDEVRQQAGTLGVAAYFVKSRATWEETLDAIRGALATRAIKPRPVPGSGPRAGL
jgi:CheY-like chemotaxis protein